MRAIGSLSVPAEDAIPDLVLTLEDPVAEVKNAAEEALTTILEQQPELHAQMEAAKGQASAAARATLERILASVGRSVRCGSPGGRRAVWGRWVGWWLSYHRRRVDDDHDQSLCVAQEAGYR